MRMFMGGCWWRWIRWGWSHCQGECQPLTKPSPMVPGEKTGMYSQGPASSREVS